MNNIEMVGFVVGGLALFIYGIDQMSEGLKSLAGHRIRDYIEKYTSNLLMAVLVGTIITGVLNSSTAVTVISISLVRAGLMKLEQAIGITIGANIGTCFTSIMIGLNIEQFAYYIICIGVLLMLLCKKKTYIYIGKTVLGFGLLFAGMQIMGDQLVLIAQEDWFEEVLLLFGRNPWLALIGGTVATAVLQSSAAVIGIVQKLYTTGAILPAAGAAFIFGSNVGTTLTAIIAGAGGSVSTKRAAWFHAVYNILGALIGMLLMIPFLALTNIVNDVLKGSPEMWIAQAHFLFNIASTLLILPFVKQSVALLKLLIPGEDRKGTKIQNIDELDYNLVEKFPSAALQIAKKNTLRMGNNVLENVKLSNTYLLSKNSEDYDEIQEIEALVDKYDTTLSKYLLKIAQQQSLTKQLTKEYSKDFLITKQFERISDLAVILADFYKMGFDEKEFFSKEALNDLKNIYQHIEIMIEESILIYRQNDTKEALHKIKEKQNELEELVSLYRDRHFNRMKENICVGEITRFNYIDIIYNMERIGALAVDIASHAVSIDPKHNNAYNHMEEVGSV